MQRLATKLRRLIVLLLVMPPQRTPTAKLPNYGNNTVINHPKLKNSRITFKGTGNILYCESPDYTLQDATINFEGNNSVIYLSRHTNRNRKHRISIYAQTNTAVYIGKGTNFHTGKRSMISMTVGEEKNIIIGDDCLFSLNIQFRTSDGHAAYNATTGDRINHAGSILIGDHVWVGQDVTILKGSRVGSGSIIGAGAILTGKTYPSNTSIAGVPARVLQNNIFFTKPNINGYDHDRLTAIAHTSDDSWVYQPDSTTLDFSAIDSALTAAKSAEERLVILQSRLTNNHPKNRFYI